MKKLLFIIILSWFIFGIVMFAVGEEKTSLGEKYKCSECTPEKQCSYTFPSGDGCNMCSGSTWCKDDKWYTSGYFMCTLASCRKDFEIPNPFK
jgi:hypothetical protein